VKKEKKICHFRSYRTTITMDDNHEDILLGCDAMYLGKAFWRFRGT